MGACTITIPWRMNVYIMGGVFVLDFAILHGADFASCKVTSCSVLFFVMYISPCYVVLVGFDIERCASIDHSQHWI